MRLCIDWGNTLVKAAIFNEQHQIAEQASWNTTEALEGIRGLAARTAPIASILCSVQNHSKVVEDLLRKHTKFILLDSNTPLPIMNAYHSPETLGADRLAMAVAANAEYPGRNNLVIGIGTCITYNFVTANRTFRGGAISPGMHMRLQAMHHFTGKLPEVKREGELLLLGYDTETCMRSGAVYGMTAELHGMLQAYEGAYPQFNAVLTGGDAPFFARQLKNKIFAAPNLVLKGLYLILQHNAPQLR
jgi:type III pantothenate kinase